MAKKEGDPPKAYTMAPPQLLRQAPSYPMGNTASMHLHSGMLPTDPPYHPSMPSALPPSRTTQAAPPTQAQVDPLEQRILDLLYPYRDECFVAEVEASVDDERKVLILCEWEQNSDFVTENIAFFIRHTQSSFGKIIEANDVSLASRNWRAFKASTGPAGIGFFVNGNGATHNILRVRIEPGESVIDCLTSQIDGMVQGFFPELWNGQGP